MLSHLNINNFAIVEQLDLEMKSGMSVISGETGAGKSIMLDALSLCLGDRGDASSVRDGAQRADILATFDIRNSPQARAWLVDKELCNEDNKDECILRRVISREGRSRGYINGCASPLSDLRTLGEMLIDIHSQHEHQSLLKRETHQVILDNWAQCNPLCAQVAQSHKQRQILKQQLHKACNVSDEQNARLQLLSYQHSELSKLDLKEGEVAELEQQHQRLSHAETTQQDSQEVLSLCRDNESNNALSLLNSSLLLVQGLSQNNKEFNNINELLSSAQIQISEAVDELQHFNDNFDADPQTLKNLEDRLSEIHSLARKHRLDPHALLSFQHELEAELAQLQCSDEDIERLELELDAQSQHYQLAAQKLSKIRQKAALKLGRAISKEIQELGMSGGEFIVELKPIATADAEVGNAHGLESVEFLVSANPGQEARPMIKVASGGELSRISLAIQVISAQQSTIPSLVFDEVDVGIGGGIAEIVGQKLRQLGSKGQVICVTHQAQVASQGHHHLRVAKQRRKNSTQTQITDLDQQQRIEEVARMLGGIDMTEQTLAHAQEMLGMAQAA